jgi:hypothetical protein
MLWPFKMLISRDDVENVLLSGSIPTEDDCSVCKHAFYSHSKYCVAYRELVPAG